jgi:hypothetical protein
MTRLCKQQRCKVYEILTCNAEFSKQPKDWPNVRSPMMSTVTRLKKRDKSTRPFVQFSCSFWINLSKYFVRIGS